jgi:hypothetical protein
MPDKAKPRKLSSMSPPYRTIYILAPANVRTGGPEACHQLGRALIDLGHDARMVYIRTATDIPSSGEVLAVPVTEAPMPPEYAHYAVPMTWEILDQSDNAVVFPEIWPEIARAFRRATPVLWWQSIDNGLRAVERFGGFAAFETVSCVHLSQSYYAVAYLAQRGILALPVFDYTSPDHAGALPERAPSENRVLYPARGRWFTNWLRRWAPDLEWQEISGFTPAQVNALFQTSKLYVDFGSHPGKDRMPREAATHGCCIITGQRGSAGNPFEVPIPARYKFRDSRLNIPRIARAIREVLSDYDQRVGAFSTYRQIIAGEQSEFLAQVARAFGGVVVASPGVAAKVPMAPGEARSPAALSRHAAK